MLVRKGAFPRNTVLTWLCYGSTVLVLFAVWIPLIRHYSAADGGITGDMINKARSLPDDVTIDEITSFFKSREHSDAEQLVTSADNILQGQMDGGGLCPQKITMPFDANDIDKGLPICRLSMASFELPGVLLDAYDVTGRDGYLLMARDVIVGWALYERSAWLPQGLLWNDHAISARIAVLANFWKHYRNDKHYKEEVARVILQMVSRSGQLLSRPSLFTFSTNHGIMQNLALWQICLAFPTLPNIEYYKHVALDRLHDQMKFYVNDEGMVLEHSAGYHRDGLEFLSLVFRYLTLLDMGIPEEWTVKFEKAKAVYAQLRRPDGSVPGYGDTGGDEDAHGPLVANINTSGRSEVLTFQKHWMPEQSFSLYPVAGYSIWWDGLGNWPDAKTLSQTTIVWSYFPGQAHKHADEMSVLLYAGGQTWWTNAGYWTYGTKGRAEAESWDGSNAPHLVEDNARSARKTELKYYGETDRLAVIDLERNGPGLYASRRQIIHYRPDVWIVLDSASGDTSSWTRTIWTTPSDVVVTEGKFTDSYYLQTADKPVTLQSSYIASRGAIINHYKGSLQPFAGWVNNEPADALVIEQPANNSWSVAMWSLGDLSATSVRGAGKPFMRNWMGPESWDIILPQQTGQLNIGRDGNRVYGNEVREIHSIQEVKLKEAPVGIADKYNAIRTAYRNAAEKYPTFRDVVQLRWRMTYLVIVSFVIQEVVFIVYRQNNGRHYERFRSIAVTGWLSIIGLWQAIVYWI